MIKSVSVMQVVKFTGKTRHCTMPVLSYEMAVPLMFYFIKIKLQEVGKHKPAHSSTVSPVRVVTLSRPSVT